ncbi:Alpha 1,4-glycosyltransferase domain containing protein [Parasponia andersonii]|uniref:Alpha 1,4-glycosyltransferase domain containing protein n=1 Tax=Parasponia andersonii TaxID=3476 RepID=A0A2P5B409_PARAD|nr:Alpha 1,4-glycosyltransferase domain containing protein [Parasponia andersonii]
MEKKASNNEFSLRIISRNTNEPIFLIISFAAIFCMIYVNTIVSDLPEIIGLRSYNISDSPQTIFTVELRDHDHHEDAKQVLVTSLTPTQVHDDDDDDDDSEVQDSLILPKNLTTRDQRILWFHRKLPESELLNSNELTREFHSRVLEFLNQGCGIQFFMTWFSPAKTFGNRELLAMETLFKSHPQGCLMIISRTMDSKRGYRVLKPVMDRGFRVLTVTPDIPFLLKNTPAEAWLNEMRKGNKDPGFIPFPQNLSNLIRLALLYKYGGVYLDTDFIVLKGFSSLRNTIATQSENANTKQWTRLNNAVLIFDIKHPLLYDFMEEFALTFNGNKWGFNGPYLVSRVVERVGSNPGYSLTIVPPKAFYPVNWIEIRNFLKQPGNETESAWVERKVKELNDGGTFAVHIWNSRIKDSKIEKGSVLAKLISGHCIICKNIYA